MGLNILDRKKLMVTALVILLLIGNVPIFTTGSSTFKDHDQNTDKDVPITVDHTEDDISDNDVHTTTLTYDKNPKNRTEFTLINGDDIIINENGKKRSIAVESKGDLLNYRAGDDHFVHPRDLSDKFDLSLFNIDTLQEQGLIDNASYYPLIIEYSEGYKGRIKDRFKHDDLLKEKPIELESINSFATKIHRNDIDSFYRYARSSDAIEKVFLDKKIRVDLDDSIGAINGTYARKRYNVSGEGVTVAVLDTGIDETHPDLDEGKVIYERDFTGEGTYEDMYGHGTHCAAIIAGDGDASNGTYTGVAPNASLMNVRVLDSSGMGYSSWIADGVEYAVEKSADIISMSLGGGARENGPIINAVNDAMDNGTIVFIAAGNSGDDLMTVGSPGNAVKPITVGAYDDITNKIAEFSSRGPTPFRYHVKPDVVAPGVDIISARASSTNMGTPIDEYYTQASGTSMATPHVSGLGALLIESHPTWNTTHLKNNIISNSDPNPDYSVYSQGAGYVNTPESIDSRLIVSNATTSFGMISGNEARSKKIDVRNIGNTTYNLDIDCSSYKLNDRADGNAETDKDNITLEPNETRSITLTVDTTGLEQGIYSGRLTFTDGDEDQVVSFGYIRAYEVEIEKKGLDGRDVEGDYVYLVQEESDTYFVRQYTENLSFTAFSRNYTIVTIGMRYSNGSEYDRPVQIYTIEEVSVTDNTEIILDENDTEQFEIDPSDLEKQYGDVMNLEFDVMLITSGLGFFTGVESFDHFDPGERPVLRVSRSDTEFCIQTIYAQTRYYSDRYHLDVPRTFNLVYEVQEIQDDTVFSVDQDDLVKRSIDMNRNYPGQRFRLGLPLFNENINRYNQRWIDFFSFSNIRDRKRMDLYINTVNISKYRIFINAQREDRYGRYTTTWDLFTGLLDLNNESHIEFDINSSPLFSNLQYGKNDPYTFSESSDLLRFKLVSKMTYDKYRFKQIDYHENELKVKLNGDTILDEISKYRAVIEKEISRDFTVGDKINITYVNKNDDAELTTRSSIQMISYLKGEDVTPPVIKDIDIPEMNSYNTVHRADGQPIKLYFTVEDASDSTPAVGYSERRFREDFRLGSDLWDRADVEKIEDISSTETRYRAYINQTGYDGRVNLGIICEDENDNKMSIQTFDAFRITTGEKKIKTYIEGEVKQNENTTIYLKALDHSSLYSPMLNYWFDGDKTDVTTLPMERTEDIETFVKKIHVPSDHDELNYNITTSTDTLGDISSKTKSYRILKEPKADAGGDRDVGLNQSVLFDGSGSSDDINIVNYTWTIDKKKYYGVKINHTFKELGIYDVGLNVTDTDGLSDEDKITITVKDMSEPTAVAGPDKAVDEGAEVSFDASSSSDNVGITNYTWMIEGVEYYGEAVVHVFDYPGTYTVELIVKDEAGNSDEDTVNVTVRDITDPTADAGKNRTVNVGEVFELEGTGSSDDVDVVNYTWTIEGIDYHGERIEHSFSEPGTYMIKLTVKDEAGNTDSDKITVTVEDRTDPSADAGDDKTVSINEEVTFDGSGSFDNIGIAAYKWTISFNFINEDRYPWPEDHWSGKLWGGEFTGKNITFKFTHVGSYEVTLNVTDYSGNQDTDTIIVEVVDETKPVAVAGPDKTVGLDEEVVFNGSGSSDNGFIEKYVWAIEGNEYSGEEVTHSFSEVGTYYVTLTVKDTARNSDSDTITMTVEDNVPPTASFDIYGDLTVDQEVTADASESSDNVEIETYEWNFGDGTTTTGENVTHTFEEAGNYTVTLTVTDEEGNTDSYQKTITVEKKEEDTPGFTLMILLFTITLIAIYMYYKKR